MERSQSHSTGSRMFQSTGSLSTLGHLPSLGVTPTYVKMCLFVHAHILAPSEEIREGNTATQSHLADMEGGDVM